MSKDQWLAVLDNFSGLLDRIPRSKKPDAMGDAVAVEQALRVGMGMHRLLEECRSVIANGRPPTAELAERIDRALAEAP